MLYIGTKVEETMKLKIHWKATAMAVAWERMVFGKSSAMYTQQGYFNISDDLSTT